MKNKLVYTAVACLIIGACVFLSQPEEGRPVPTETEQLKAAGSLQGKIILVDAGHGGYDGGARATKSGTWEKEINLQVAKVLEDALVERGALVIMTRREDKAFASTKRPDLDSRLQMAKDENAGMLISVHMNKYHSEKESGPQVFYRKNQPDSRLLAGAIQQAMIQALHPPKERTALAGDYYMLSLDIPSVLVECGFLSNGAEEALLLDSGYQARLADAIACGVEEYYRLKEMEK